MAEEIVMTDLTANASQFLRAIDQSEKAANSLKRTLLDLVSTVNNFEKAMNVMKAGGIKLNVKVDGSALDRAESDIRALDGSSVNVDVTADTSRAESRIKSLEDVTNSVDVPVSADTGKAESEIKSLDGADVTAQVDGDTSRLEAKLDSIRNIAALDLIINVTENLENAPIVGGLIGRDKAEGVLQARTGLTATESAGAIEELYTAAYGESAEEIANNIALVEQLNLQTGTLADNTAIAWDTASIAGEDFTRTLEVMDKLVKSGLVADFQEASDVIVGGIQEGANRSGDFLDTLREYSSVFADGGYSAETAVSLMVQALEAGTFNTDKLGDTVKENILKINEALGDVGGTGGTARPILEKFDLLDDAALIGQAEEAGGITAAEFADMFLSKLATEFEAGNIDLAEFNFAIAEVFGVPAEDLGFDIFKSLDFAAAAESEGSFEGVGAVAAQQINDNLGTAFTGLGRTIEIEIVKTLADAGIDLNKLLDDAKEKAGELGELLRGGTALPEALEIVLSMPGLAATLHGIESVMGNVYLAFLDIIAKVQDLGGDTGGAAATRELIAEGGERQLAFDIKLAGDTDDVLRLLDIAEGRGVDPAAIGTAVSGAATELINQGDLDRAQELLDTVNEIPDAFVRFTKLGTGEPIFLPLSIDQDATQEEIDAGISAAVEAYLAAGGYRSDLQGSGIVEFQNIIDTSAAQSLIDSEVNELRGQFDTAMDSHNWVEAFDIATRLGDTGGVALAQSEAQKTGEDIMQAFADGINLLNPFVTEDTPVGFVSDQMQQQIDGTIPDWREELNKTPESLRNMGLTASEAAEGIGLLDDTMVETDETVAIFGVTVDTTFATARDNLAAYSPDIIAWLDKIRDAGLAAGGALGNVVVPGGAATGGVGAGSAPSAPVGGVPSNELKPSASGGTLTGWGLVGDAGVEAVFADDTMAVLNNNTTAALMAGMQMMGDYFGSAAASGGSVYNDNRVINLNTANNNYNSAQRGSSDARIAKAVKGF